MLLYRGSFPFFYLIIGMKNYIQDENISFKLADHGIELIESTLVDTDKDESDPNLYKDDVSSSSGDE